MLTLVPIIADMEEMSKPNSIPPTVAIIARKYTLYILGKDRPMMAEFYGK